MGAPVRMLERRPRPRKAGPAAGHQGAALDPVPTWAASASMARNASGSRTGSQTSRPTGSHGPSHHCQTTWRGSFECSPMRRWITMTIEMKNSVPTLDATADTVGQGSPNPRNSTPPARIRWARVMAQPATTRYRRDLRAGSGRHRVAGSEQTQSADGPSSLRASGCGPL